MDRRANEIRRYQMRKAAELARLYFRSGDRRRQQEAADEWRRLATDGEARRAADYLEWTLRGRVAQY